MRGVISLQDVTSCDNCIYEWKNYIFFRAQLAIGGCVLMALNDDVPCTMDEINAMMEKPSVRQGLLDAIPNDCGTLYCILIERIDHHL